MGDRDDHAAAAAGEGGEVDAVGKVENVGDGTPSSMESTPEPEQDGAAEATQEPALPQKRKGGRKPVRFLSNITDCSVTLLNGMIANGCKDLCYL